MCKLQQVQESVKLRCPVRHKQRPHVCGSVRGEPWILRLALASQDFLCSTSTRQQIHRFMQQGYVAETLQAGMFWDEDFRCGGPLEYDFPRPAFIPSMQTTRKFNYGRSTWLKVEYGPDRSITQPEEPDYGYQWRSAGPQEPERDWQKHNFNLTYRDPYRRPALETTCDYTMVEEPSDVAAVADEPAEEDIETKALMNRPMTAMAWWDLLADLSCAIDFATDAEDLAHRINALDPRIKRLSEMLPRDAQDTLAAERRMYRQAMELFKHMSFIDGLKEGVAAESKAKLPSFLAIVAEVRKAVA